MRSNYKPIGELVTRIDERNINGEATELIGVSIDKCFIKSVANTIGTDLTKYKIIRKDDFAVSLMQVSRDSKIPVARQTEYDIAMMSPAYPIFRVTDKNVILPEYLDMWFKRTEFDREAAFIAVGGVRGSMPWDEFAQMEVHVPDIEVQRKIVRNYQIIEDRIALKKKINDNLSQQAICIIQKTKEQDSVAGKPWSLLTVQDLVDRSYIASPMDGNHGEIHPKVSDYVTSGVPFIMANNLNDGYVDYENCAFITEQQANTLRKGFAKPKDVLITHKATLGRTAIVSNEYKTTILTPQVTYYRALNYISPEFLRYFFETSEFQKNFEAWAGAGSTRAYIGITKQLELPILLPGEDSMRTITESISKIEAMRYNNHLEIIKLSNMQKILLSEISSC